MRDGNFRDTEYRSYYYTKIRHEDDWNEEVKRTRQVKVGEDKNGNPIYKEEVYWETVYHPDEWYKISNSGGLFDKKSINREEYEDFRRLWNTEMRFIDMHRNYYTIDGDAQEYDFCGHWEHLRGYTEEASYENRVAGSNSVLKFKDISKEEAKELGLFDYSPSSTFGYHIGKQKIDYLNMYYGKPRQIHIKVLAFPYTKGVQIVEDQKAYWQGGNKNELVVCIGIDRAKNIKWADCFSWQDNPELDVRCKTWLLQGNKKLNLIELGNWLEGNLVLWKRKEFKDFSYISSFLTGEQNIAILVTIIILSILGSIGSIIIIENELVKNYNSQVVRNRYYSNF